MTEAESLFGIGPEHVKDGEGWAHEVFLRFGTHNSTHVDAPYHYNSEYDGKPARRIDELPLDWFFAPGVVLDMQGREDGETVDVEDVEAELERIGYELNPLDIVMIWTGRDKFYEDERYIFRGPGVTADATKWLYEKGVRVMGIDAWGWDAPFDIQSREALSENKPGIFWAAHQVGLEYSQIERLYNLEALPSSGFYVSCLPLKIVGGSAAPARVVALVPKDPA